MFFFFVFRTLLYFQLKQARTRIFKSRVIIRVAVHKGYFSQLNHSCNSSYNAVLKLCVLFTEFIIYSQHWITKRPIQCSTRQAASFSVTSWRISRNFYRLAFRYVLTNIVSTYTIKTSKQPSFILGGQLRLFVNVKLRLTECYKNCRIKFRSRGLGDWIYSKSTIHWLMNKINVFCVRKEGRSITMSSLRRSVR